METISNQAQVTFSYGDLETTKTNNSNVVNTTMKDEYSISVENLQLQNVLKLVKLSHIWFEF